ncbi:MAG TPA: phosphoglucomutase/phosphomannomutase family protein [Candidatus Saccharimonadales bacterium]|nr:phosphoglucomutase/phosphomannomutase family protein [Candidatus Saccharimonadales bacterium]
MTQQIKFGTDGWRGVIADDYTFENVRRVADAIANYVHQYEDPSKGILVAYDTRFGSRRFAEITAEAIAASGIRVQLAREITPTPALSYMVKKLGSAGGVMITSSHNPWDWNGVKFKASYGGSASPAIIKKIEALIDAPHIERAGGSVVEADFKTDYIAAVKAFVDLKLIAKAKQKFAVDVMYGAGRGIISGIFTELGVPHIEIHGEIDPLFPGMNPEPILPHLRGLQEAVVAHHCDAGLATDGDADRIGAVTEDGSLVDAHKCYAVLLEWLLKRKQWPGVITRAFNTTKMLDRIAKAYNRELIEHGIGFKYVADIVLSGKQVLIGGEESGGIGLPSFLPERDGTLNALLLANVMAEEGKSLGHLVEDLQQKYGRHYYGRRDLRLTEEIKQSALRRAAAKPATIGNYKVHHMEDLDGSKFFLEVPKAYHPSPQHPASTSSPSQVADAEAWVLIRGSGTEPLLRVYCEASSQSLVDDILEATLAFVHERSTTA